MATLEGIHHVTSITADARRNLDFYGRVLGLRLVKKTVNQDDPTAYHLFYADEDASAGADMTFFEYPGVGKGEAGPGMVHRVGYRVGSEAALDFWADRLAGEAIETERQEGRLRFADPEGLELELVVSQTGDEPLAARFPEIPDELALQGFDGVYARSMNPSASQPFLEDTLGFTTQDGKRFERRGEQRGSHYTYEDGGPARGVPGAGTVHHVAWSSPMADHQDWRGRVEEAGRRPTPVIDRFYFKSIYFREPGGILFEIATMGPGFAVDEPQEELGERLSLPPDYEHLRSRLEGILTPLVNPRTALRP
ncbi:MAG: glyoxalase family protein [Gaiellales bacterium]|jgi:glyoxalase family protein|nr:glyoxalase family protein [Gaiellales bacterium]